MNETPENEVIGYRFYSYEKPAKANLLLTR